MDRFEDIGGRRRGRGEGCGAWPRRLVTEITQTINFDLPPVPADYLHRVGRTARMEAKGEAITFVASGEENNLHGIEKALGKTIPASPSRT